MVARQYKLFSWRTYFAATLGEWVIYHPELNLVQWPRSLGCLAPIDILMTVLLADASDSEWVSGTDVINKFCYRGDFIFSSTAAPNAIIDRSSDRSRPGHTKVILLLNDMRDIVMMMRRELWTTTATMTTRSSPSAMQSLPRRGEVYSPTGFLV